MKLQFRTTTVQAYINNPNLTHLSLADKSTIWYHKRAIYHHMFIPRTRERYKFLWKYSLCSSLLYCLPFLVECTGPGNNMEKGIWCRKGRSPSKTKLNSICLPLYVHKNTIGKLELNPNAIETLSKFRDYSPKKNACVNRVQL